MLREKYIGLINLHKIHKNSNSKKKKKIENLNRTTSGSALVQLLVVVGVKFRILFLAVKRRRMRQVNFKIILLHVLVKKKASV
jgi:hypothetical protein